MINLSHAYFVGLFWMPLGSLVTPPYRQSTHTCLIRHHSEMEENCGVKKGVEQIKVHLVSKGFERVN